MATVDVHATGARYEGVTGSLLDYYQGEANTVGGYSIDGVAYPAKSDVPTVDEVAAGVVFDPADHTVEQVQEYLADATPAEQDRVIAAERDGKARVTLLGEHEADES